MRQLVINIPEYKEIKGITYSWEDGFEIRTDYKDGAVIITANRAGLLSLAKHLFALCEAPNVVGLHLHYDDQNSLEDGSVELIIERRQELR